jgi:hypothetical protein
MFADQVALFVVVVVKLTIRFELGVFIGFVALIGAIAVGIVTIGLIALITMIYPSELVIVGIRNGRFCVVR